MWNSKMEKLDVKGPTHNCRYSQKDRKTQIWNLPNKKANYYGKNWGNGIAHQLENGNCNPLETVHYWCECSYTINYSNCYQHEF